MSRRSSFKLFRYRRPSINTILGITRAKKRLNKELGITAAMKPFRWWSNEERKIKRRLGYYSPLGQLLRNGPPRFMGLSLGRTKRGEFRTAGTSQTMGQRIAGLFATALLVVVGVPLLALAALVISVMVGVLTSIGGASNSTISGPLSDKQPPIQQFVGDPRSEPAPEPANDGNNRPDPQVAPAQIAVAEPIARLTPSSTPARFSTPDSPVSATEPVAAAAAAEKVATPRAWRDRKGTHHVVATFLAAEAGDVLLRKSDGKQISVPIDKLSDDDCAYLHTVGVEHLDEREIAGKVVGITDDDTLVVLDDQNDQRKIRLGGIDFPEKGQEFGPAARHALAHAVLEKSVVVKWRERDELGRTIGDLYLDGRWINKEMVENGWAWHYRQYSDSEELALAQSTAQRLLAGLWRGKNAEPPWEYRQRPHETTVSEPHPKHRLEAQNPIAQGVVDTPQTYEPSSPIGSSGGTVHVKGYYRKDGTYVAPHSRSSPHHKR